MLLDIFRLIVVLFIFWKVFQWLILKPLGLNKFRVPDLSWLWPFIAWLFRSIWILIQYLIFIPLRALWRLVQRAYKYWK